MTNLCTAIVGLILSGTSTQTPIEWGFDPKPEDLPKLRQLSDLYWAYWSDLTQKASVSIRNLNHYVVWYVQNDDTHAIILRVLQNHGASMQSWPGHYFGANTDDGLALIGEFLTSTGYTLEACLESTTQGYA